MSDLLLVRRWLCVKRSSAGLASGLNKLDHAVISSVSEDMLGS